jgi:hypothetical protein
MAAVLGIMVSLLFNISNNYEAFNSRRYSISECNSYLSENLSENDLVIGAWAPSLTWEGRARSFPVWYGFLNYEDPIAKYNPRVVVSEIDQVDSEMAYQKQGIDLFAISDSVKTYKIGIWNVGIFWISNAP